MWLFLLAALHRMQALSALACSVGCGFVAFASLKIALFIQPLKKGTTHFLLLGRSLFYVIDTAVEQKCLYNVIPTEHSDEESPNNV